MGADNETNLSLLHEAEALQAAGIDLGELSLRYQLNRQDWDELAQLLATCHCLVAGWMADIYHWRHHAASPRFPAHLPQLAQAIDAPDLTQQLLEKTIALYAEILPNSEVNSSGLVPELTLKLAHSLAHLPDQSFAKTYLKASLHAWLDCRQLTLPVEPDQMPKIMAATLAAMQSALIPEDRTYFETLAECFALLGDDFTAQQVRGVLAAIATLAAPSPPQAVLRHTTQVSAGKVLAIDLKTQHCQVLASQDNHHIQAWQLPKAMAAGDVIERFPRLLKGHQGKVLTLAISVDGQTLVSSDLTQDRSYIKIWELATGRLCRTLMGHRKAIHALALSADGQMLISGSHKIKLWRLRDGQPFRTLFGHRQWVYALAATPDAQTVISGGEDAAVKIWDVRTGELRRSLKGHRGGVRSLTVSPDGQWVVSSSEDHTLQLWNLPDGKVSHTLKAHQGAEAGEVFEDLVAEAQAELADEYRQDDFPADIATAVEAATEVSE